ncbi:carboxylesterase [Aureobasidium subglaciale]|nr:carboxylesterase [Aureobasidium subglaciale]
MSDINLQEVCDFLINVAKSAGDVIIAARPSTTAAGEKVNSVDLVTETDQATERLITELVHQEYPHFEFMGEETYKPGDTLTDKPTLICDPVDGTTNFIHGYPYISISLGLAIDRKPVVGVIYNPFTKTLFSGVKGQGSFLSDPSHDHVRLPLRDPESLALDRALVAVEWGSDRAGHDYDIKVKTFRNLLLNFDVSDNMDLRVTFLWALILVVTLCAGTPTLIAELDYGTFEGSYSQKYNLSYWQKIPFAAPPVGQNRFRGPQPPKPITNGTYNSTQSFDMCPQRTVNGSEDCLYLGLYSRPWTEGQALRPVVVVFYGGGFIQGSAYFSIPPSGYPVLNVSNANDFVFVYTNYRVNAFGLLPGKEIAADPMSDLNPGLLDQHAALQWTNKHILKFGGDPQNVTIWGQSAGGGSVVAQVIAQNGKTSPSLFSKALASSPFWPKTYKYNAPQAQALYNSLAELTGCAGPNSLQCLKTIDVQTIRNASLTISGSRTYNTSSYAWSPVIDGTFLTQPLSSATAKGQVNIDYGFEGFAEGLLSYNTTYVRAGLVFRDTVLACPAYWMAGSAHRESYLGEYTISPAKHASDTIYWNQVNAVQKSDPLTYQGYAGAFASFFQTGDPDAHKLTNKTVAGVPEIESEEQFLVSQDGFSDVSIAVLAQRCDYWRSVAHKIPI